MEPADRDAITTSIANLWTLHAMVLGEVIRAVHDAGALSPAQCRALLERIDGHTHALEGEGDQQYATAMLATIRRMLEG